MCALPVLTPGRGSRVAPRHANQYSGEFSVRERGTYLVTAQKSRDGQVESTAYESLVLSYPTEFAEFETNRQLLNELASRTNGIFEPSPEQIAQHRGPAIEHLKPLSSALLRVSLILFVSGDDPAPSQHCERLSCGPQGTIGVASAGRRTDILANPFALEAKEGNPDGRNSNDIQ